MRLPISNQLQPRPYLALFSHKSDAINTGLRYRSPMIRDKRTYRQTDDNSCQ